MKPPKAILRQPYHWHIEPKKPAGYRACILEFTGCSADGDNAPEAVTKLHEAASAWIRTRQRRGLDVPGPFERRPPC